MFWKALRPLLADNTTAEAELDAVRDGFGDAMAEAINAMWASKLGLSTPAPELAQELLGLMLASKLDYTIFFRQLSEIPQHRAAQSQLLRRQHGGARWQMESWLQRWRELLQSQGDLKVPQQR